MKGTNKVTLFTMMLMIVVVIIFAVICQTELTNSQTGYGSTHSYFEEIFNFHIVFTAYSDLVYIVNKNVDFVLYLFTILLKINLNIYSFCLLMF